MILLEKNYWEVKTTENRGEGLFASKNLDPGIVIGDYLGKVLRTAEVDIPSEKENFYLMYYHDQASIYPDLTKAGVHLFNHSCSPNSGLYTYQGHILFFSLRHIFAGEELTVSYMLPPKDASCVPCNHICECGSEICRQTMHMTEEYYAKWREFQDKQAKQTKRKRINYNKDLPPLDSYPKLIPDNPIYSLFGIIGGPAKNFTNKALPSVKHSRSLIRDSGRTLEFPMLNKRIIGVVDNALISESLIN